MPDRTGVRNPPKSGQERQPLNRSDERQGSNKEHILATKVTNPHSRSHQNIEGITTLYFVKALPILTEMPRLWTLLNDGTIEAQEPDGREILASMRRAVRNGGQVEWHETCYCNPPLRHERATVYDHFFEDMEIEPSVTTTHLEGESFWRYLEARHAVKDNVPKDDTVSVTRYVPVRIF